MQLQGSSSTTPRPWYGDWVLIPLIGVVYLLDQVTKYMTEAHLCPHRSIPDEGPFRLTCSFNTGTAFGFLPDQTLILVLASFVGIGVLLMIYHHHPFPGLLLRISLGLQLGGAIGNLTDRLRFGQVTDFVQLGFWPVFNLADASIVVGVIMLVWLFLLSRSTDGQQGKGVYTGQEKAGSLVEIGGGRELPHGQEAGEEQDGD